MLKFLGQQAIFKAVPRPALRYCNRMAPRWVHSSQGGKDVSGAGANKPVEFWLGCLEKQRQDLHDRFEKERQKSLKDFLDRFEKKSKEMQALAGKIVELKV
jgi:hypothetical protein